MEWLSASAEGRAAGPTKWSEMLSRLQALSCCLGLPLEWVHPVGAATSLHAPPERHRYLS